MNSLEIEVLGFPIRAEVRKLDSGWTILVEGGMRTHVGSVTLAEPDGTEHTLERPGHRESSVSRLWAQSLAKTWNAPVCVCCGIHYDNATPEQLQMILAACSQLLNSVIELYS